MKNKMIKYHNLDVTDLVNHEKIEFKKINSDQFAHYVCNKQIVEASPDGYITDSLLQEFNKEESSTILVNVGIGQGKTTAIYKYIEESIKNPNIIVILASPFITLVEKDYKILTEENNVDKKRILIYSELGSLKSEALQDIPFENILLLLSDQDLFKAKVLPKKQIHIITINSLLGNPGEQALTPAKIKHHYLSALLSYCKENSKKVILILDEIHESIHNFANPYIYNLLKWKDITHKSLLLTATYTEPVNIVAKHFAYLTNDHITILEAPRIKQNNKVRLHLHFTSNTYSSNDLTELQFIKHIIKQVDEKSPELRKVQILSFSKKIAKAIYDHSESWLPNRNVNLSTSNSKDKFDSRQSNIGTNFKTGVNIITNDLYFIILPCKYSEESYNTQYGIFSDGSPSIIQAIARLRLSGDIYIIIPPIQSLIQDSYVENFLALGIPMKSELKIKQNNVKEDYTLIEDMYNAIYNRIKNTEEQYKIEIKGSEENRPIIQYPNIDTFTLEKGQYFLTNRYLNHGNQIAPFIIWCAFQDQFVNSTLHSVSYSEMLKHKLELFNHSLNSDLQDFFNLTFTQNYFDEKSLNEEYIHCLEMLREPVINGQNWEMELYLNGNQIPYYTKISTGRIHVVAYLYKKYNGITIFNKSDYINANMYISSVSDGFLNDLGYAYRTLWEIVAEIEYKFRKHKIQFIPKKDAKYLDVEVFADNHIKDIAQAIKTINKVDPIIKGNMQMFKGIVFNQGNHNKIYNHFMLNFFSIDNRSTQRIPHTSTKKYKLLGTLAQKYSNIPPNGINRSFVTQ